MTRFIAFVALSLSFHFTSYTAFAAELSQIDQEALKKTTSALTNKSEREKIKQNDAALQKVDSDVEKLAGDGKNKEAMYEAASKILGDMAKEANGDADKMAEIMQKAQANPAKFMESLSESNKQMIRGIANDIEKSGVDSKQP